MEDKTRVEICEYRGWIVLFNTESETFFVQSDEWDRQQEKRSFSSAKKYIDDFIKDNLNFEPVWVETLPSSYSYKKVKVIGIRKDGRFIYENEKGDKEQISDHNLKDYIFINEENKAYRDEIKKLEDNIYLLSEEVRMVKKNIIGVPLETLKEKYLR